LDLFEPWDSISKTGFCIGYNLNSSMFLPKYVQITLLEYPRYGKLHYRVERKEWTG
jgi:hypothetical protein